MRCIFAIVILTAFFALPTFAQESVASKPPARQTAMKKADAIYNEMMLTISPEVKAKIDSTHAKNARPLQNTKQGDSTGNSGRAAAENAAAMRNELEGLPRDVRLRVESAIREMEKRKNERVLEFKDIKRNPRR